MLKVTALQNINFLGGLFAYETVLPDTSAFFVRSAKRREPIYDKLNHSMRNRMDGSPSSPASGRNRNDKVVMTTNES